MKKTIDTKVEYLKEFKKNTQVKQKKISEKYKILKTLKESKKISALSDEQIQFMIKERGIRITGSYNNKKQLEKTLTDDGILIELQNEVKSSLINYLDYAGIIIKKDDLNDIEIEYYNACNPSKWVEYFTPIYDLALIREFIKRKILSHYQSSVSEEDLPNPTQSRDYIVKTQGEKAAKKLDCIANCEDEYEDEERIDKYNHKEEDYYDFGIYDHLDKDATDEDREESFNDAFGSSRD